MGRTPENRDEKQRKRNRLIYETLAKEFRITLKDLSTILGVNPNATSRILQEAFDQCYVLKPQLRKRSYSNLKEYTYFLDCKKPLQSFLQYIGDTNIVYHAEMTGFSNLWIIAKEKIDFKDKVILEGWRSDFHVAYAPDHSWEEAIQLMWEKAKAFNPDEYEPKEIIETHWNETIPWDSEDEAIFRDFKHNGRKRLTPIMRKNLISSDKIYKFIKRWSESCTVFTRYFPMTISAYDPHLLMFETDYEDFLIDLFSELPTSPVFFKVADYLFMYANLAKDFVRSTDLYTKISRLQIPLFINHLFDREILKGERNAILRYYWRKGL